MLLFGSFLLQVNGVDDVPRRRKRHLTLIQRRNGPQQMKRPDVPHFRAGNDLQSVGMERSAQALVQLVKFVNLDSCGVEKNLHKSSIIRKGREVTIRRIPQDTVRQDELVAGVERCSVLRITVGRSGRQTHQLLARGNVVDGGRFTFGADDLVLDSFAELDVLFLLKRIFHVEKVTDGPQTRVRRPVHSGRQQQVPRPVGFDVEQITLVALICGFFGRRVDVEQLQLARLIADHQKLFARRESTTGERLRIRAERADGAEPGINQLAIQTRAFHSAKGRIQRPLLDAHRKVDGSRVLRFGIRTLVREEQVKLRARHHRILAEGVLIHQIFRDDRVQRHRASGCPISAQSASDSGHAAATCHTLGRGRRLPTAQLLQNSVLWSVAGSRNIRRRLRRSATVTASAASQIHFYGNRLGGWSRCGRRDTARRRSLRCRSGRQTSGAAGCRWCGDGHGSVRRDVGSRLLGGDRRNSGFLEDQRSRFRQVLRQQVLVDQLQQLLLVELDSRLRHHVRSVDFGQRNLKLVDIRLNPAGYLFQQIQSVFLELDVFLALVLENRIPHQHLHPHEFHANQILI